ncbi:ACT domain-containing protein [Eubacterium sp. AB3007]|jgi:ACT domain-containing protein|uniref:ACT domain-containing protein n=1 Tax=Eubacterium sp. AB3007 TaxID=1392487 RepID=UPI00068F5C72|nr:ACT domain-containing protein [Eubacterium sp. AB3007]MBQ1471136.1 ACT domain-containing protein [Eubacterium sp.]
MNETIKAVATVVGKDDIGVLTQVSGAVAAAGASVMEVTQSVLEGYFCMIMILNITDATKGIDEIRHGIEEAVPGMQVHVMHENIFNSMHRI